MAVKSETPPTGVVCHHCGDTCSDSSFHSGEKTFCCAGCQSVYQILEKNNLCDYYSISEKAGIKQENKRQKKFSYLNEAEAEKKFMISIIGNTGTVKFFIPVIHCSSCIWLLEHLGQLDSRILQSRVNFLKKEILIQFDKEKIKLSEIAGLLSEIGYEPWISLEEKSNHETKKFKSELYKIGITGFCFANIMMLSFPEYFSDEFRENEGMLRTFSFLNLFLSLPVFFYGASQFFLSSYKAIKQKMLNIDAPIALAILITFTRSIYEISTGTGSGYLDSMSGIVFFMLLGRYFQDRSHHALSFERDFTSYFPLGVTTLTENGGEKQRLVTQLQPGMRIKIHDGEIIPVDAILFYGKANLDYSFVTGESTPVATGIGEIVYAGAKQIGGALELEVIRELNQSYLTELWSKSKSEDEKATDDKSFIHDISRYFALFLLITSFLSFAYWQWYQPDKAWTSLTAVLIVACPCTLLLSATFTFGGMQTHLAKAGFFLKNSKLIESIHQINTIVFDKTGTISENGKVNIHFEGEPLSEQEKEVIGIASGQSLHPHSRAIWEFTGKPDKRTRGEFSETLGGGIKLKTKSFIVELGSDKFIGVAAGSFGNANGAEVYVKINGEIKGRFILRNHYRENIKSVFSQLKDSFQLYILSGDKSLAQPEVKNAIGVECSMIFEASPHEKMKFIQSLRDDGKKVMMIGDGLNDAGALGASDFGIVVSDELNNFTPASHAIISGSSVKRLPQIISYCKKGSRIILASFLLSLIYNLIGLSYAIRGELKPVIAAILMPASSISIIGLTALAAWFLAQPIRKSEMY